MTAWHYCPHCETVVDTVPCVDCCGHPDLINPYAPFLPLVLEIDLLLTPGRGELRRLPRRERQRVYEREQKQRERARRKGSVA